jgi:hypothetical protein
LTLDEPMSRPISGGVLLENGRSNATVTLPATGDTR